MPMTEQDDMMQEIEKLFYWWENLIIDSHIVGITVVAMITKSRLEKKVDNKNKPV